MSPGLGGAVEGELPGRDNPDANHSGPAADQCTEEGAPGTDQGPYPGGKLLVGRQPGSAVRGCPAPVVEARAAHAEDAAQPLHAVATVEVGDALEAVHQRVFPAKYLAALAFLLQLADLLPQSRVLRFKRGRRLGRLLRPAPRGRLTPAARTQFRRVSGVIPRSAAIDLIVASGRDSYSATASALN
ncbi:hypothetical protein [Streptomyces sp. NPDC002690]